MRELAMPGWETAKNMTPKEIVEIIDCMALQDYRDGALLAARWSTGSAGSCLDCDCRDPHSETQPGTYFLGHSPALLYEGLRIAGRALGIERLQVSVSAEQEPLAKAQFQQWPEIAVRRGESPGNVTREPVGMISHSAETFVHVAQLFRREGADKRLCYVSGCGITPRYLEVPLTSTVQEIAEMAGASRPVGAWIKTEKNSEWGGLNSVPQHGSCPKIEFG